MTTYLNIGLDDDVHARASELKEEFGLTWVEFFEASAEVAALAKPERKYGYEPLLPTIRRLIEADSSRRDGRLHVSEQAPHIVDGIEGEPSAKEWDALLYVADPALVDSEEGRAVRECLMLVQQRGEEDLITPAKEIFDRGHQCGYTDLQQWANEVLAPAINSILEKTDVIRVTSGDESVVWMA